MVLDVHLQDGTGVHVCRQVRSEDPSIRGVLLTSSGDEEALVSAILAGASGYVVKLARGADLVGAVRAIGTGRSLIARSVMERLTAQLTVSARNVNPPLTDQELLILEHMVNGETNRQIAETLMLPVDRVADDAACVIERILTPSGPQPRSTTPTDDRLGKHRHPG